jgi:hypothetical protein
MRSAPRSAAIQTLAAIGALAILSCSVSRLSESYRCENTGDCDDGRICDRGFCVEHGTQCPTECSACNGARTCVINCNANRPCGDVHCPLGFDCEVRCNNAGACGAVDCSEAGDCEVNCSGPGSCGAILCGKQECAIDCSGIAACPVIDCVDACACDVDCNNPAACPLVSCPQAGGTLCTDQQEPGAACDSSVSVVCDTCN